MTLEDPHHFDHGPQPAPYGSGTPPLEEAVGARRIDMPPEPVEPDR